MCVCVCVRARTLSAIPSPSKAFNIVDLFCSVRMPSTLSMHATVGWRLQYSRRFFSHSVVTQQTQADT